MKIISTGKADREGKEGQSKFEAVVIAPDWPGTIGGLNIAIRAELTAYQAYFRRVHLLVLSDRKPLGRPREADLAIHILSLRRSPWIRFALGLFSRRPAITLQYRFAFREVRTALRYICSQTVPAIPPVVIFSALPTGVLIPLAREIFPASPVIVHGHNVISQAFAGFARKGSLFSRMAWSYELVRIRGYERWIATAGDRFWTISEHDREAYRLGSNIKVDDVLGVYLDVDRFSRLPPGDPETLVHVGRIDLRKGRGMYWFIQRVWPLIRREWPSARLLLGGRGTERFDDPTFGISGRGFVEDEREILGEGMIAINPQLDGSGIQLKSIVAMLAGRLLVTTVTGGEGVAGNHPTHFLAENVPEKLAQIIIASMRDPQAARETARRGQLLARQTYNQENFLRQSQKLLVETMETIGRRD